eukprot:tig00020904_g15244.t1
MAGRTQSASNAEASRADDKKDKQDVRVDAETLREFLSCSICLETLVDPRALSCSHTFCSSCLRGIADSTSDNKQIRCPVCRKATPLGGGFVDDLPRNVLVVHLLETVQISALPPPACAECGPSSTGDVFCPDCRAVLCSPCSERIHSPSLTRSCPAADAYLREAPADGAAGERAARRRRRGGGGGGRGGGGGAARAEARESAPQQPQQPQEAEAGRFASDGSPACPHCGAAADLFCEAIRSPVCRSCAYLSRHAGHPSHRPLATVAAEARAELRGSTEAARGMLRAADTVQAALAGETIKCTRTMALARARLQAAHQTALRAIEERRDLLEAALASREGAYKDAAGRVEAALKTAGASLKGAVAAAERASTGDDAWLLRRLPSLLGRLRAAASVDLPAAVAAPALSPAKELAPLFFEALVPEPSPPLLAAESSRVVAEVPWRPELGEQNHFSPNVDCAGWTWSLCVVPSGRGEAAGTDSAAYLYCRQARGLPAGVELFTTFRFSLLDAAGRPVASHVASVAYTAEEDNWGSGKFVPRAVAAREARSGPSTSPEAQDLFLCFEVDISSARLRRIAAR